MIIDWGEHVALALCGHICPAHAPSHVSQTHSAPALQKSWRPWNLCDKGPYSAATSHAAALQEEFLGATKLCKEIKRPDGGRTNWQRLFEPYDFFKSYKNYLQV